MKDIDFDELDRAVNSLMASVPNESTPNSDAPASGEPVSVSSQPATTPEQSAAQIAVTVPSRPELPQAPKPVVATAAPAIQRSGRFMDMVPASGGSKPRTAPAVASREGLSISPRTEAVEATPQSAPIEPAKPVTSDAVPAPVPQSTDTTPEAASSSDTTSSPNEPYESPFLADAKVDKRPLNPGTSSDQSTQNESKTPEADAKPDSGADEPPAVPQIPELNSDLIAIESNESLEETPLTQAIETADAAASVPAVSTPLGSSSIPQQYTTKESSGDQSHAAIYDAAQYPEPIAHPAKKKAGWLWVLWVIVLLGVGAGGAVLLYTLGIIP